MHSLWRTFIRFSFRLLYQELAWTYDAVSWLVSLGRWRRWQRTALPYVTGRDVLEIGHGPGHMLRELAAQGYRVTGLDLSRQMGQMARQRTNGRIPLVRGKGQTLPFADASFDTVLSTFPTEYVLEPETITGVYRVLRRNGRFLIVPEGHLTGDGPLHGLIDWLFHLTGQRSGEFAVDTEGQWPHPAVWRPFRERFTAAGFRLDVHTMPLPDSAATIIVAQK